MVFIILDCCGDFKNLSLQFFELKAWCWVVLWFKDVVRCF